MERINFEQTSQALDIHKKEYLRRTTDFRFSWTKSAEEGLNIIERGANYVNPDYFKNNDFQRTDEMNKIATWMKDTEGKGLSLIGSSGRGKTMFLHGILPHLLIAKGKVATITKSFNLPNNPKSGILLIDEIGREDQVFDKSMGKIDRFPMYVDYCCDHGIPLFITSNMSQPDFISRYGVWTYNRLSAVSKIIIFNGEQFWNPSK